MLHEYYRKLQPINDLVISPVGLGTVKFGRNTDVKYPHQFNLPDDKTIQILLAQARELGINLIDTAPAYGNSEQRLGQLLNHRPDWVICTKVGETYENHQSAFDFSSTAIKQSIHRSLSRLKTDYLDIVLIHSDGNDCQILDNQETVETLTKLKQQGIIRAIGLSGKTTEGGIRALETYDLDLAMVTFNPQITAEKPVIDYAQQHNKSILVKKALASGHLNTKDKNPVQTSMNFIFQSAISAVILGTINPMHLQQNCQAVAQALKPTPNS